MWGVRLGLYCPQVRGKINFSYLILKFDTNRFWFHLLLFRLKNAINIPNARKDKPVYKFNGLANSVATKFPMISTSATRIKKVPITNPRSFNFLYMIKI